MTKTEKESKTTSESDIEALVASAVKSGFDELPLSTSELEKQLIQLFKDSKKPLSPRYCRDILRIKDGKWYSDKIHYLSRKNILVKTSDRGYYRYNKSRKTS